MRSQCKPWARSGRPATGTYLLQPGGREGRAHTLPARLSFRSRSGSRLPAREPAPALPAAAAALNAACSMIRAREVSLSGTIATATVVGAPACRASPASILCPSTEDAAGAACGRPGAAAAAANGRCRARADGTGGCTGRCRGCAGRYRGCSGAAGVGRAVEGCGQRPLTGGTSGSRIIGGHDAPVGAWPWLVSLQVHRGGGRFSHVCGGVLVNKNSVLTAGHCVTGRKYVFMSTPLFINSEEDVVVITVHPEFKRDTFENDIALFELNSAVRYSIYVQPICLPSAHLYPHTTNGTQCFITGWGRTTEKGKISAVLQEAQVEIIPSNVCNSSDAYGGLVNDNMICAGSRWGGTDTCQGDSGGPLACYHPPTNRYYLMGIASFGVGCGQPRFPGIYVRLSQYRRWIKSELQLNNKPSP
uniref:Peptidase S1 domain-containing protein n=1 Tax=Strigops habroptila TaxID=2489341 RepID=A0A672V8P6_STRHB